MKKKDMDVVETLRMSVDIPKVVQEKADEAFEKIRQAGFEKENNKNKLTKHSQRQKRFSVRKAAVIIAAATLVLGSISAAAAYFYWSRSLPDKLQITEELKTQLEEEHAVAFAMQECTVSGVKVTAVQSITDRYFTHIVFKVEGYQLDEGVEPGFADIGITVGGKTDFNMVAGFYNGIIMGADGKAAYADGTLFDGSAENRERYLQEDGSLEYNVTLSSDKQGYFLNQPIHVELRNLGITARAECTAEVEGVWSFDWNLQGTKEQKEFMPQKELGDTKATVVKVEISSISFRVEYNLPRKRITETGLDENGNAILSDSYTEPPMLTGIKMKDGSLYTYLNNGGSFGYAADDSDLYVATFAMSRIIDVGQIDSLLFEKSYPKEGEVLTEDNFYVVAVE